MSPVILPFLLCAGLAHGQTPSDKELGRKALETVLTHTKSRDSDVRGMAVDILGQIGNKSAAGILKKLLSDGDRHTRLSAAEALWNLGDQSGLRTVYAVINDVPARSSSGNSPLEELKIISQNKIREHAIEALARMQGEKAADVLFSLKNDTYGSIRDVAARELARLGYADELAQFLDAVTSEDEAIRFEGANILAKICNPGTVETLRTLLGGERSMRVRIAALDAMKCMNGKKNALPELLRLADDANPTIKFKAVAALGVIRDKKAFDKLTEIYGATNDIALKIAALKGLMNGGRRPDENILAQAFDSNSQEVKQEALKLLRGMPDADARQYLGAALKDDSVGVRLGAALQILKRYAKKQ